MTLVVVGSRVRAGIVRGCYLLIKINFIGSFDELLEHIGCLFGGNLLPHT